MKLEQEQQYEIAMSEENELMITIRKRDGEAKDAVILYDGGEHALFYRDPERTIVLDYIHPQVRELLKKASQVMMAEKDESGEIANAYEVGTKIVKKLPLSRKDIITLPEGQEPNYPEPDPAAADGQTGES